MFKSSYILLLFCLFITQVSCKKFVEVDVPLNQLVVEKVFNTDAKAEAAVSSIYGYMVNGGTNHLTKQLLTLYGGYASDELSHYTPNSTIQSFLENNILVENSINRLMWSSAYQTIYYANACLEGIMASPISEGLRKRLSGELKVVRSLFHFYLVQLFGAVPLVTSTDYALNALVSRSDTSLIYEQILKDLTEASEALSSQIVSGDKIRPTRYAAKALLARVYLILGEWEKAEDAASEILNSGYFLPLPPTSEVFLKTSHETIWHLMPVSSILDITTRTMAFGVPQVFMNSQLRSLFNDGDQRLSWMDSIMVGPQRYYFPAKYKNISSNFTEYFVMLRAAEQLFIRAEARARQGKFSAATTDLNVIRGRAGLSLFPVFTNINDLLLAIEEERFKELFAEHADRWFFLKRTGKAINTLTPIKPDFHENDLLFPIPSIEIMRNPNLTQNPGY